MLVAHTTLLEISCRGSITICSRTFGYSSRGKVSLKEHWIDFGMSTNGLILFVALAFIYNMCQAQKTDFGRLSKNVEILVSATERCTNETADIRKDLGAQNVINEDFGQILEKLSARLNKLEAENQALNQTMIKMQNDNEKTEMPKLQATCTCKLTTTSSTPIQTTTIKQCTTEPTATASPTTEPITTEPTKTESLPATTEGPLFPHQDLCDEGWSEYDDHCYIVPKDTMEIWDDALDYCKSMDSYLIEITTDGEFAFASGLLSNYVAYWIGATDKTTRGRFVYQHTGLKVPENFWKDGYPERKSYQTCAQMILGFNQGLELFNVHCRNIRHFVCEKAKSSHTLH